jgi:hypothetical protein
MDPSSDDQPRPSSTRLDAWLHKVGIAQQLAQGLQGPDGGLQLDDGQQGPLSIEVRGAHGWATRMGHAPP